MTTIVFGSCMSAKHDSKQKVWADAKVHKPEWLILCGDNIYMDWGLSIEAPRKWPLDKFAKFMFERYAEQFEVPHFRSILGSIPAGQVLGVWDDHDFAWNNCYGTDPHDDMPQKRLIARAMHHHYFEQLNARPLPAKLPALSLVGLPNLFNANKEIYRAVDVAQVRVLLCDVRFHREDLPANRAGASLLGAAQEKWLFDEIKAATGPLIVVSGSVLKSAGDQSWDFFGDFYTAFLKAVSDKRALFVGGDIHKNRLDPAPAGHPIEVISSNAALGFPFSHRHQFGVIDISDDEASFYLYRRAEITHSGRLAFKTGAFRTSSEEVIARPAPKTTARRAAAQKSAAMRKLFGKTRRK